MNNQLQPNILTQRLERFKNKCLNFYAILFPSPSCIKTVNRRNLQSAISSAFFAFQIRSLSLILFWYFFSIFFIAIHNKQKQLKTRHTHSNIGLCQKLLRRSLTSNRSFNITYIHVKMVYIYYRLTIC